MMHAGITILLAPPWEKRMKRASNISPADLSLSGELDNRTQKAKHKEPGRVQNLSPQHAHPPTEVSLARATYRFAARRSHRSANRHAPSPKRNKENDINFKMLQHARM